MAPVDVYDIRIVQWHLFVWVDGNQSVSDVGLQMKSVRRERKEPWESTHVDMIFFEALLQIQNNIF